MVTHIHVHKWVYLEEMIKVVFILNYEQHLKEKTDILYYN